jgi:hypothetical protein
VIDRRHSWSTLICGAALSRLPLIFNPNTVGRPGMTSSLTDERRGMPTKVLENVNVGDGVINSRSHDPSRDRLAPRPPMPAPVPAPIPVNKCAVANPAPPIADTSVRGESSTSVVPWSTIADVMVAQLTPNAAATCATGCRPVLPAFTHSDGLLSQRRPSHDLQARLGLAWSGTPPRGSTTPASPRDRPASLRHIRYPRRAPVVEPRLHPAGRAERLVRGRLDRLLKPGPSVDPPQWWAAPGILA